MAQPDQSKHDRHLKSYKLGKVGKWTRKINSQLLPSATVINASHLFFGPALLTDVTKSNKIALIACISLHTDINFFQRNQLIRSEPDSAYKMKRC